MGENKLFDKTTDITDMHYELRKTDQIPFINSILRDDDIVRLDDITEKYTHLANTLIKDAEDIIKEKQGEMTENINKEMEENKKKISHTAQVVNKDLLINDDTDPQEAL